MITILVQWKTDERSNSMEEWKKDWIRQQDFLALEAANVEPIWDEFSCSRINEVMERHNIEQADGNPDEDFQNCLKASGINEEDLLDTRAVLEKVAKIVNEHGDEEQKKLFDRYDFNVIDLAKFGFEIDRWEEREKTIHVWTGEWWHPDDEFYVDIVKERVVRCGF